jgi:predicted kinase
MAINNDRKKIIVVCGYLAAGKSTFAVRLSRALRIPYLLKDTSKTALCAAETFNDQKDSSRFSAITFNGMMYVAERLLETGFPFIIEGNFVPAGLKETDEAGVIKALIEKYGYQSLTFKFYGDTGVLHKRFIERDKSTERLQLLKMFAEPTFDFFEDGCRNLDAFSIGGIVKAIDATDFARVDFDAYIEEARVFMG